MSRHCASFAKVGPLTGSNTMRDPLPPVTRSVYLMRSCSSLTMTCFASVSNKACRFDLPRVRVTGTAPTRLAILIAARPTLLEAAGIRIVSPLVCLPR